MLDFDLSVLIPATPRAIYDAWLTSAGHAAMTGATAEVSSEVGGSFSAWGGYITGQNLDLETGRRIVQAWRTTQFTEAEADSRVEILLEASDGGTLLTINHSELPEHGMQYLAGWRDHYVTPMTAYFGG